MTVQVKIGTVSWEACPDGIAKPGYVLFSGAFVYDVDGLTALMLWDQTLDGGVGNVRAMTAGEITAFRSGLLTAVAQAAKAAATAGIDNGALQVGDKMERIARAIALLILDELNILRACVQHPIVSITRSGNVATVTCLDAHGLASGDPVRIMGATLAAYNVVSTATVTNATVFTYPVAGTPVSPAVGSIWFAMGAIPATQPRTIAQLVTAIKTKIASTAE